MTERHSTPIQEKMEQASEFYKKRGPFRKNRLTEKCKPPIFKDNDSSNR